MRNPMVALTIVMAALLVLGVGVLYEEYGHGRAKRCLPAPGRLIDVGGRCLHMLDMGSGPGPTIIIEQGAGSPSLMWWPVQRQIAAFARVVSYDRAGYLWSDPPARCPSIDDRIEDLRNLLERASVPGPYVLVAHSYGGLLAMRFEERWPAHVVGLVLVDAPPKSVLFKPSFLEYCQQGVTFQRLLAAAARVGLLRLVARWLPMLLLPDDPAARAWCLSPAFMSATADDFASIVNSPAALRTVERPGQLGDKPLIVLAHGIPFPGPATAIETDWTAGMQRAALLSRNSRLTIARRSNHMIHMDEPALVVDAVRRVHHAADRGAAIEDS